MKFPLVGNERLSATVGGMLASNRIPHAVLIEGDSGTGKTVLASYLCRAAVCEREDRPCGECDGCRLQAGGNHPDVSYIAPEKDRKTISVNQIRDIITAAAIRPQKSGRRVFVIDPGDSMTPQAQNALLKILEEPPSNVVFILTTISKSAMLETVVSRCTVLTVSIPDEASAIEYIASKVNRERDEIAEAYRTARGSIGNALNILKKKSASAAAKTAESFIGLIQSGSQYELLKVLLPLEKDRAKTLEFYNTLEAGIVTKMRTLTSPTLVRRYERLYNTVASHKKLLKANANLSLLLTSLAVKATAER